jgi:tripartite ATP-independent transporter DctP family solute receptor
MTRWKSPTLAATTLLVLGAIAFVGPTTPPVVAQTKAPGPPITLRLTWTTSLDTHVGKGATHFVNRAKELTNGQVNVLLFPNSGLGSEQQALEGMQAGTVDMGLITVFTNAVKVGVVLDLPFLFRDVAHWKKSVEGPPGRAIAETAPAAGVRILAWYLGGWRDVYGSRAIKSVDDFKGLKIRTQQAVALVEFFKAVGAIPTPIAWPETYLALQQKTVDAAETALWAMYDAKQYEVAKFAVETHHAQSNIPVMMSEQKWKTLSPEIRQALVKAAMESADVQQKAYQQEADAMVAKLKEKGITFTTPDLAPFRDVAKKAVHQKLVTDPAQKAILAEIEKL